MIGTRLVEERSRVRTSQAIALLSQTENRLGANSMLAHQSPLTDADEYYLQETLVYCRVKLEAAIRTSQRYNQLSDLTVALADALTGCNEALTIVGDPKTYQD